MSYTRFAIYYVPQQSELAEFGARWLGWDILHGEVTPPFDITGLAEITTPPRKYGFHATLKPPFRLAAGYTQEDLAQAVADLAQATPAGHTDGLRLSVIGRFLALTPEGPTQSIDHVAASCVQALDPFRAAPSAAELTRRRQAGLSPRQEALLVAWGYPYVLDEFRFHLTLSGRLQSSDIETWRAEVENALPPLPEPFNLDRLALAGEREIDGHFEVIQTYALSG